MRLHTLAMLLLAHSALAGAPAPSNAETLQVIGFSEDAKRFAVVMADPTQVKGRLVIWNLSDLPWQKAERGKNDEFWMPAKDGKATVAPEVLAPYALGNDPGQEQYKGGTKVSTSFTLNGVPLQISIEDSNGVALAMVSRGNWCRRGVLFKSAVELDAKPTDGNPNLVSVLSSRDGSAIAIVIKFRSERGGREFAFATMRIAGSDLLRPQCVAGESPPEPKANQSCIAEVGKLKGRFTGPLSDHPWFRRGGNTIDFTMTVAEKEGAVSVRGEIIRQGVHTVPHFEGTVTQCWKVGETTTLKLEGTEPLDFAPPGARGGFIQLTPDPSCQASHPCFRLVPQKWHLEAVLTKY